MEQKLLAFENDYSKRTAFFGKINAPFSKQKQQQQLVALSTKNLPNCEWTSSTLDLPLQFVARVSINICFQKSLGNEECYKISRLASPISPLSFSLPLVGGVGGGGDKGKLRQSAWFIALFAGQIEQEKAEKNSKSNQI